MKQIEIKINNTTADSIDEHIKGKKVFIVCKQSAKKSFLFQHIINSFDSFIFSDYSSNPKYDEVVEGVIKYREYNAETIIAIGGGSAIDVAKCILLFADMSGDGHDGEFLTQEPSKSDKRLIAIPTTAGTGSEANRFAVIYYKGEKVSVQ
ncbi:MAG: iron-containing alcohol dehydrogenase, partial [Pseudobutyrivibrio sp.]|nr:iron-containing alcohol dehydrogenase [Pseudobutyrivibrio sp.]